MRTLGWLALLLGFLYADQNLLAPNLTAVATDLGLDKVDRDLRLGGLLTLAATASAAAAALLFGPLADRFSRVRLLAGIVIYAELTCLASGFARSWEELLILRSLTAAGLGGALPVALSLLGDLASTERRGIQAGVLWTSTGAGIILGMLVAGQIGPLFGWRATFAPVALPGIVLALWFAATVREPRRSVAARTAGPSGPSRLRRVIREPVNRLLFLEAFFEVTPLAVTAAFLPDFLAQDRGFTVQQASLVLAAFGAVAIVGKLAGGWCGDLLFRRRPASLAWLAALALVGAVVPALAVLRVQGPEAGGGLLPALLLIAVVGFLAPMPKPLITSLLLHANPTEIRGTVFGSHRFAVLAGRGLAPLGVASLSLHIGRAHAMSLSALSWVVAALLLVGTASAVRETRIHVSGEFQCH